MSNKFECRDLGFNASHLEFRTQSRKLGGYAATYGTESGDLGGFTETIVPGAFRSVLSLNPDVALNFNHDNNIVLGRTGAGTLNLSEDDKGLRFEASLADTPLIRDMVLSPMQRGEIKGMSFAFRVAKEGQSWASGLNGLRKRTINTFSALQDVAVVVSPAYDQTSVGFRGPREILRELTEIDAGADPRIDLYRRRLALAEGKRYVSPGSTDYKIDLYKRKLALLSL